ncbi:molybdopterin-dependent oxidoreductase [Primorskyibacter sp. 2E233]|uniref:molybdopterin-dependent oxidoreductase n=1 Tax=Primorskyibacter sp. 2E233 TaxID=3413431 RepID=UPI003BEFC727
MIEKLHRICLAGLLVLGMAASAAAGSDLPHPEGPVVLRVFGALPNTNIDGEALFDLQMLRDLPSTEFETTTIWTDGVQHFGGVSLGTLLEALGINSGSLEASALNEYLIEIPLDDAVDDGALIAYEINGKEMSVRDKGPLWIVYPYDDNPEYRSEVYYARSIWQLDTIEALP